MELYQKQKAFSEFFLAFLKSILNFKYFPKKDDPHSWCILGNPGSKKYGSLNSKKPSDREHGKWVETLLQSEWHHLYNIH